MAYKIYKKEKVSETLELYDAAGNLAESITVELDLDGMALRLGRAYQALAEAQQGLQQNPTDAQAFGEAVIGVFRVIFGDAGTEKILRFYDGAYSEMLADVAPFINEAIMPKIREWSAARRDQIMASAKK